MKVVKDWSKVEELCNAVFPAPSSSVPRKNPFSRDVAPGGVLLVGQGEEVLFQKAFGCRSLAPEPTSNSVDTVYDVASLTKAMATTTIAMHLVAAGKLDLNARLSRYLQTFGTLGKDTITARHLLSHSSGLPAYVPFYRELGRADSSGRAGVLRSRSATEAIYQSIARMNLERPVGAAATYSDVGFILLGQTIESILGAPQLQKFATELVFKPLGLRSTGYIDLTTLRRRGVAPIQEIIAPTNNCPWRKKLIWGEVQDENAWAMGGVAAHAGLYSTVNDVFRFSTEMIRCFHGDSTFLPQDLVRLFWTRSGVPHGSTWALGWDTPSRSDSGEGTSSSGKYFSAGSVGHLGYTGCSLWIDPERRLTVVLLTNRVHPNTDNQTIKQFRPLLHDLVMETLGYGH